MNISIVTTVPEFEEYQRLGEEIVALGHEFVLVDFSGFSFNTKKGHLELEGLEKLKKSDLIVVRGLFSSIKPISEVIKDLRKKGIKVFDNNILEHSYAIDKVTDLLKLALEGIVIPKTCYDRSFESLISSSHDLGYPLVIKSTNAGKGAGVFKAESATELKTLTEGFEKAGKQARYYLTQEFIDYKYDIRALVIGEKVFAMRRIPAEGEFRANFSLGGSVELFELDNESKDLAIKALSSIGMSIGGVDILITDGDKKYILEVNHTAGFIGMEKATGENIGKLYIEHAMKEAK